MAGLLQRRRWQVDERAPAADALAGVISALRRVGHGGLVDLVDVYADAAESVAAADLDYVQRRVAREQLVESVVVGTVLGEAMFAALRRLAHQDASVQRYELPGDGDPRAGEGASVGGGAPVGEEAPGA